jgi:uncharacterized membrane protein YfcA
VAYLVAGGLVFVGSGVMAMAGLGAAFLFVPLFYYLGVPLPTATATALALNVVSLGFATATYWRARLIDLTVGLPVLVTAVALAPLGARVSPAVDTRWLLGLFIAFLVFAGAMMVLYRGPTRARLAGRGARLGAGAAVGATAGFLGGLLGVGGGNLILPALHGAGVEAKRAAGTTALAVVFASLAGFAGRVSVGGLDAPFLAVCAVAAAAGSLVGAHLMQRRLSSQQLKRVIGVVLWVVALTMAWDLFA